MTENKPIVLAVILKSGKVFVQEEHEKLIEGKPAIVKKFTRAEFTKNHLLLYYQTYTYYSIPLVSIEYKIEQVK